MEILRIGSMDIKAQIDQDIKQAMLAGNKTLVTTLRGVKSAILYAEVAAGVRDKGLAEVEVMTVLGREAKKRCRLGHINSHSYYRNGSHRAASAGAGYCGSQKAQQWPS
jgi:uncharacterized protein YqeY